MTQVSSQSAPDAVAKKARKSTKNSSAKLVKRTQEEKSESLIESAFYAQFLIQCTLPHSDPGDVPVWERKNGSRTLVVQPGWDPHAKRSLGYPYGIIPRLTLIWMITEAKRTNSRRIQLGPSLAEFMRTLNLNPKSGGKGSSAQRMKEQIRRLLGARISYHQTLSYVSIRTGKDLTQETVIENSLAQKRKLVWESASEAVSWNDSWIELSLDFFESIQNSVPCDMRAIKALQRSPLAIDLYMLCAWLASHRDKHVLTWDMIGRQLGCDYADRSNIKKKFKTAMEKVKLVYPKLRFHYLENGGGIVILASQPSVPRRKPRPF